MIKIKEAIEVTGTTIGKDIDTCAICGHDLRHTIHLRVTEGK